MASRKIEVQLVGDAGDLERALAGALASLKLLGDGADKTGSKTSKLKTGFRDAETGLFNFDKAAKQVNKSLSGGPFGLFGAIGSVVGGILKLGGVAQKGEADLGKLASAAGDGEGAMSSLGSALSGLAPLVGVATSGFVALGAAFLVLPALAGAATFAFVALLATLTTLTAVVAALAGPLTLLGALLGGLAAAFVIGGKKALAGKGQFKEFADTVEALGKQFNSLASTLGSAFLPYFVQLAGAAKTALTYLSSIAKLPLKQAFQSLSTTGVAMFSKFVYGVANVLKKPFTLAIKLAFGSGGQNAQSAITGWWDSLTAYLFGYTSTHQIKLGDHVISIDKKQVDGALQPILDWFHGQDFTGTGIRWAKDIIQGLVNAWNHDKAFRDSVKQITHFAGQEAGKAFKAAFFAELHAVPWKSLGLYILHQLDFSRALERLAGAAFGEIRARAGGVLSSIGGWISSRLGSAWNAVKSRASSAWSAISSKASGVLGSIASAISSKLSQAWNAVKNAASNAWSYIKGLFSQALSIHVNWPSPPGWLSSLGSGAGGLLSKVTATGGIVTGPQVRVVGEAGPEAIIPLTGAAGRNALSQIGSGGGGSALHFHFPNALVVDANTIKQAARLIQPELNRMQARSR